jgi:osmotically inducible protein OsmC
MDRSATVVWNGPLKGGKGRIGTDSGALSNLAYGFGTRFENERGTNPEELIAAAHAACFSMALSGQLGQDGITADSIHTKATVTLDKKDAGWTVTKSHLSVSIKAPGAEEQKVRDAAARAKSGCPISRLLNTEITMDARVEH